MATVEVSKISDQGMVVIPAEMLRHLGMETGSLVCIEERAGSVLIRPAAAMETEAYTPERQAEFLLANAIDMDDYTHVVAEVRRMGLDPESITHHRPDWRTLILAGRLNLPAVNVWVSSPA